MHRPQLGSPDDMWLGCRDMLICQEESGLKDFRFDIGLYIRYKRQLRFAAAGCRRVRRIDSPTGAEDVETNVGVLRIAAVTLPNTNSPRPRKPNLHNRQKIYIAPKEPIEFFLLL